MTIIRGSPACLGSQRGTHEKICVSNVIAPFSHSVIFIHRRGGDVISDYPGVTSLPHDVYFHIGHVQHDSTYCFHYSLLLYYDICSAFIIGT